MVRAYHDPVQVFHTHGHLLIVGQLLIKLQVLVLEKGLFRDPFGVEPLHASDLPPSLATNNIFELFGPEPFDERVRGLVTRRQRDFDRDHGAPEGCRHMGVRAGGASDGSAFRPRNTYNVCSDSIVFLVPSAMKALTIWNALRYKQICSRHSLRCIPVLLVVKDVIAAVDGRVTFLELDALPLSVFDQCLDYNCIACESRSALDRLRRVGANKPGVMCMAAEVVVTGMARW